MDNTKKLSFDKVASIKEPQSWTEKVLEADDIWSQVKNTLTDAGETLPKTPRRPDVRLILNNISGQDITFRNPGDHSNSKPENIPGDGDKTATMVMIKGETLEEQFKNAETLALKYNLTEEGFTPALIEAMNNGDVDHLIDEAYGPAPYESQSSKLIPLDWQSDNGSKASIIPVHGNACSYGAREATEESVFLTKVPIFIKGSGTTPELLEADGMCIVASQHYKTKIESTRPIVPSVARSNYGLHYHNMPKISVHPDGSLQKITLNNGKIITPKQKTVTNNTVLKPKN